MLAIDEMGKKEIKSLLSDLGYGHLGCVCDGYPYVVPMAYRFEDPDLYMLTTEGMKTKCIDANPAVCLQVEEVNDKIHWRSIVVIGDAKRVEDPQEVARLTQSFRDANPTLEPAINRTWIDAWGKAGAMVFYRIHPKEISGRTTVGPTSKEARTLQAVE
jgi:uncharacterized protein